MIVQIEKTKEFYFNSFRERGLFSNFTGLEDDLESQYNKILKTQYSYYNKGSQGFHFNVKTNIEQDNFDLYYLIDKANKIIKSEDVKNYSLPISTLYSDISNLEKFKKDNLKGKIIDDFEPIIVSNFIPINTSIVIDGNHRMNAALKYADETGNSKYVEDIINKGNFQKANPSNYGYKTYQLPTSN